MEQNNWYGYKDVILNVMTIPNKFIVMNKNFLVHSTIIPIYWEVNVTAFSPYQLSSL
jgi:hypothetical protein